MVYDGTTLRGSPTYSATGKFSTGLSNGGVVGIGLPDSFISSSGVGGGNCTGIGTIECFLKTTQYGLKIAIGHESWFYLGYNGDGKPQARYGTGSGVVLAGASTINSGAFVHLALVFDSGTVSLYADGTRVATSSDSATVSDYASNDVGLGGYGNAVDIYNDLHSSDILDEVRFSNVARYSGSSYTVPTSVFTSDANTVALYHLDSNANNGAGGSPPANTGKFFAMF